MFYLGVYLEQEEGAAQVAIVEKSFFSGSRRYRIVHMAHLHEENEGALIRALMSMHIDERWTAVKKVFSQSGRPPKIKREPPLILLSAWDDDIHLAGALREGRASVEGILSSGSEERAPKDGGYYPNHGVTAEMMSLSFGVALSERHLDPQTFPTSLAPLIQNLASGTGALPGLSSSWFSALGSCLWHGEFVRRVKRY